MKKTPVNATPKEEVVAKEPVSKESIVQKTSAMNHNEKKDDLVLAPSMSFLNKIENQPKSDINTYIPINQLKPTKIEESDPIPSVITHQSIPQNLSQETSQSETVQSTQKQAIETKEMAPSIQIDTRQDEQDIL